MHPVQMYCLVSPVNGPQVLETLLLGEDEHHGVVPVAAARVDGDGGGLVDHHEVLGHPDHLDPGVSHRHLVSKQLYIPQKY